MRFSTTQHPFYCGIDLHARSMSLCVLQQDGEILLPRNMKAAPEPFLKAIAPYRAGLVVAVACLFTWYGLADRCAEEGIPCVLGHALSRTAIHGGKAKNDPSDSHKMAALLRGGMLPQAYVSPAAMRATRALLRRRPPLMRKRAELLGHVHNTNAQDNLPEIGKQIADTANRAGGAKRCAEAAVQQTITVDLALIPYDDALRTDLELSLVKPATPHDAHTLSRLQTVPGIGKMLRLVLLYAIHHIERFPSVQAFASYGRLVQWSKESGGKRLGTSGKKIGHAHLTWAFAEAAPLFLPTNPPGQQLLARLEKKPDKGNALSMLAHQLGRAVYGMLKRKTAFDMNRFRQTAGSRAGAPGASLDIKGRSLEQARLMVQLNGVCERHGVHRPQCPAPDAVMGHPLWLLTKRR